MKALTGLPTSAYLKVAEEVGVPLAELLKLVPALEVGMLPAYIARYRPHVSAGLDEEQIQHVHDRLRYFLDFEDRRITILTAIGQKNKLTPELRKSIESAVERRDLEDLYLPFREKRKTPADEALEKRLEPLARFLWDQEPPHANIEAVAESYVQPENGVASVTAALHVARLIVARWLGEDPEIRSELRNMAQAHSELRVSPGERWKSDSSLRKKFEWLLNYRAKVNKVGWRQHLGLRRAVREGALRYEIVLPENRAVELLLSKLLRERRSLFCLQLGAAACEAYRDYLAQNLRGEVLQNLSERCDQEAIKVFKKNLRKALMAAPAGKITTIGLETGRPGGWRAVVVDETGELLEAAIVHREESQDQQGSLTGAGESTTHQSKSSPGAKAEAARAGAAASAGSISEQSASNKDSSAGNDSGEKGKSDPQSQTASEDETRSSSASSPNPQPDKQQDANTNGAADAEGQAVASPEDKKDAAAAENGATLETASGQAESAENATQAGGPTVEASSGGSEPSTAEAGPSGEKDSGAAQTESESKEQQDSEPGAAVQSSSGAKEAKTPDRSLSELIAKHNVKAVVFANNRNFKDVERLVRSAIREAGAPKVFWTTVNDAGTWIYATSKSGKRELPQVEAGVRSAVSLARRLQDPLAELVKIDPKLLGIGQYHSEVDPKKLRMQLRSTIDACVHQVGVDLNRAGVELLSRVPGVTQRAAKRIVEYRNKKGGFKSREQLKEVPGISERLYQQAVGFFRVYGGENILDTTGVHPEAYPMLEKMFVAAGMSAEEALEKPEALKSLDFEEFSPEDDKKQKPQTVIRELEPQVREPRKEFVPPQPPVELKPADGLKIGMEVEGVVTNVANFGAFVDVGGDQDGLVHNSHLSDRFLENGKSSLKAGDRITVRILEVGKESGRISLTTKDPQELARAQRASQRLRADGRRTERPRRRRRGPDRETRVTKRSFGPDREAKAREAEKLSKLSLDEKLSLLENKFRTKV